MQHLDAPARLLGIVEGLLAPALDQARALSPGGLAAIAQRVELDARNVAAGTLLLSGAILAGLSFGCRLRALGDVGYAPFGVGEIVLRRCQLERLAFAIVTEIAAVPRGAKPGELDDRVQRLEQFAVVADDDCAAAPARQELDDRPPAVAVEVVGRLIQQDEVRLGEDECRQPHAGALTS